MGKEEEEEEEGRGGNIVYVLNGYKKPRRDYFLSKLAKMPQCCVVPECSNRKSGHRFPKDKDLLKKWMVAIRRDTVIQGGKVREVSPSPHWRVCNDHFAPEDFVMPKDSISKNPRPILRKDVVPSRFAWTRRASDAVIRKREKDNQARSHIVATRPIENDFVTKKSAVNSAPPPLVYFSQRTDVLEEIEHINVNEIKAEPVDFLERVEAEGAEFHVEAEYHEGAEFHIEAQYHNEGDCHQEIDCPTKDVEVQCSLCSCRCRLKKECMIRDNASQTSTVTNHHHSTYFKIEHLFYKTDELKFYTGFDDKDQFMYVFNLLGDQVNCLQYFPSDQTCRFVDILSPLNQFFMTLIKLRRNMTYVELGFRFGVTSTFAGIIVVTWVNFLDFRLKELKVCAQSEEMEKAFKIEGEKCGLTGINNSTKLSDSRQQTYTIYKFCNIFKVIIGILPNGRVNFVSEAFGDSISNRELFEKSCLRNLLQDGDVILVNEGSDFQDLVTPKNVIFKTPDFLKLRPHKYARVNNLETTYEILQSKQSSDLEHLTSKIIYVCLMLANFLPNIV